MAGRDLSIVILGATGVTGRQAVRWMRERGPALGVRWGIGGRDPARLAALVEGFPEEARPELLEVDVSDPGTVSAMVERTRAVVSFAGPFARMAPPVIEACVGAGIAYVDVSGEIDFAAGIERDWHEAAVASGARIVQVAGFESLPFDLCAARAIELLEDRHGARPELIEAVFWGKPPPGRPHVSDLVSKGTFESLREAIARDDDRVLGDPAALVGTLADAEAVRAASPIRNRPRWSAEHGPLAPMIPSPIINPPVIQRSLALAGRPPVAYRESVAVSGLVPTRPAQAMVAGGTAALNGALAVLMRAPARVRRAGARAMKPLSPTGGPREDRLEGWRWRITCTATGGGAGAGTSVEAEGHPGYLATSRMTTEAGLILADPSASVPAASGYLTPAAALGTAELDRFEAARLRFSSEPSEPSEPIPGSPAA